MGIKRDLCIAFGGAAFALILQPGSPVGNTGSLEALAKAVRVSASGAVEIVSPVRIRLRAPQIAANASGGLSLRSGGVAELRGGTTRVGGGGSPAPAVTIKSVITCPPGGGRCVIAPAGAKVLIAP